MSRAVKASIDMLEYYACQTMGRMEKLVSGRGVPGTRAAPTQDGVHDTRIGSRLDYRDHIIKDGETYQRLKLQLNKGADDATLRAAAAKDSHKVWSQVDVHIEATTPSSSAKDDTEKDAQGKEVSEESSAETSASDKAAEEAAKLEATRERVRGIFVTLRQNIKM